MFKSVESAYEYLEKNNIEYRKEAIKRISHDGYYSFLFLSNCKYLYEERELVIETVLEFPDLIYNFLKSCLYTKTEFEKCIGIILDHQDLLIMLAPDFTEEEKDIACDSILEDSKTEAAEFFVTHMLLNQFQKEKVYSVLVLEGLINL